VKNAPGLPPIPGKTRLGRSSWGDFSGNCCILMQLLADFPGHFVYRPIVFNSIVGSIFIFYVFPAMQPFGAASPRR
jgi:hypothetical protein